MTDERTCRCKGQFAMHKPALHADRDGSEARARLEREHERGLAADKVEGRCRICGHGTDSDQLACAPCRAVIAGDRYAKEGWLRAERAEAKVRELQPQVVRLRQGLWDVWAALGHDTDGDTGPGALISGMGVDGFIAMVLRDAQTWRRESEEDYDADTSRLEERARRAEARVAEALAVLDGWVIEASLAHPKWGEQVIRVRHIDERLGPILAGRTAKPEATDE